MYSYSGILLSITKDRTIDTLNPTEFLRYYFKQKKLETEEYILYGSI